jgi:hypothetical protein
MYKQYAKQAIFQPHREQNNTQEGCHKHHLGDKQGDANGQISTRNFL